MNGSLSDTQRTMVLPLLQQTNIIGKPFITVSAKGIANGLSLYPNDGADFGPDTTLGATAPGQYGSPYTETEGVQEAFNFSISSNVPEIYFSAGVYQFDTDVTAYTMKPLKIHGVAGNSPSTTVQESNGVVFAPSSTYSGSQLITLGESGNVSGAGIFIDGIQILGAPVNSTTPVTSGLKIYSYGGGLIENLVTFYCITGIDLEGGSGTGTIKLSRLIVSNCTTGIINAQEGNTFNNIEFLNTTTMIIDKSVTWAAYNQMYPYSSTSGNNVLMSIQTPSGITSDIYINGWEQTNPTGSVSFDLANVGSANLYINGFSGGNNTICRLNGSGSTNIIMFGGVLGSGVGYGGTNGLLLTESGATNTGMMYANGLNCSKVVNINTSGAPSGFSILLKNMIGIALSPNIPTNPPVSGTAYQNTNPYDIRLKIPVTYSPTSSAAATLATGTSSSSTVTTSTKVSYPAGITTGIIDTYEMVIPAGQYFELVATNATIGTVEVQAA